MINEKYYQDKFYDDYKNASLQELEYARDQTSLTGSNGRGQTATVPLIKICVLDKLIKYRMEDCQSQAN
jgi:recombinational DNA repair ATPase RecF